MSELNKGQAEQRVVKLRELINDYRYHYHVLDESIMSEAAADSLKHELTQLESKFPDLITPDSPTQRVAGTPLSGFKQVRHSQRMLSLNDVFDRAEVERWIKRLQKLAPLSRPEFFIDLKLDGLACALWYEDGVLVRALTRGDGYAGEDVTANVITIESVPLRLRDSKKYKQFLRGRTEIRGEIIIYKKDFENLNEARAAAGKPLYANPRNTAAGSIRQLDPKLASARPLRFRAWDLLRNNPADVPTYADAYQTLRALGVAAGNQARVLKDADSIMSFADKWQEKRHDLPFNTDGLVIKINERQLFDRLGVVGKAPRAAAAYKYAAEQATTTVKDIFISIGRTGSATPVAMLEPVVIAGSTVQMATLHNEGEVRRKDIRVGDTVIVHKAGDIIPEVVEPLIKLRDGSEKPYVMPTECPECGTRLVKLKADEAVWRCPNEQCPSRVQKRIQHFSSKAALDIEGLGEKNVIALLNAGLIKDTPDIYGLKKEDILNVERFAEVSAGKLVDAIQANKTPPLERFLYGLGLRHVGTQTAVDLARHFHTLKALQQATIEELLDIEGVGEVVAESIVAWFADTVNQATLQKFTTFGVRPSEVKQISGKLTGQKFAITGGLQSMSREQAAERIRALGGTFQSAVGKDTDYLVVGQNVGASKLTKAKKFNTQTMNEAEFTRKTGG